MKKVLLISATGFDNFGDEAMFKVLYNNLLNKGYSVTVAYFNFDIQKVKKRYPDIYFSELKQRSSRFSFIKTLFVSRFNIENIKEYDGLYIVGSGNYTSLYSRFLEDIYILVKDFKRLGKYVEFRPQSVGPFFGKRRFLDEYFVRQVIKLADVFYVRDATSYEYSIEVSDEVKLFHDDAWNLELVAPFEKIPAQLENQKLVGISIRPFRTQSNYLVKWFEELVEKLKSNGYTPFFIPICYDQENAEYQDNNFLKDTLKDKAIFLDELMDVTLLQPENIKYFISLCEKCIGLSYHFNVFSLSQDKKIISLYYEEYYKVKNLGLQKAFGNTENVVNPLHTKVEHVVKMLEV